MQLPVHHPIDVPRHTHFATIRINSAARHLAQDSEAAPKIEVLDVTGAVVFKADGGKEAGYHEVTWSSGRGRRRGVGGRSNGGARPGTFAVRITHDGRSSTQAFTVHDRRGNTSVLGAYPGEDVSEQEEGDDGR